MEPASFTVKLVLEYDGTNYAGWQRQPDRTTIQETVERGLERILGTRVTVHGSGRTDAGVHALGQTAHFVTSTAYAPETFRNALNALLPHDIAVRAASYVPAGFHARFSARSKEYEYLIRTAPFRSPLLHHRVWHLSRPLDLDVVSACLAAVQGAHDFSAFQSGKTDSRNPVRTVLRQSVQRDRDDLVRIRVCADGFLRHMVRNLVGTLVEAGRGRIGLEGFLKILAFGDRTLAGPKAPPQGLTLLRVNYDEDMSQ